MKKNLITSGLICAYCLCSINKAKAQLSISAQVRTRTEYRNGFGAPLPKGAAPAFFTSQRSRLAAGFSHHRLRLGITVQDVRVWGQDVSTINRTTTPENSALMLHEAWAEIALLDTTVKDKKLNLKLGRQEWLYDDARLLGNLDWLQQGRRHEGALLKYEKRDLVIHAAAAFNQNKEALSGTLYNNTPQGNYTATTNGGSMYKSLQFLYAGKKYTAGSSSLLFLADQFTKFQVQTNNGTISKTFQKGSVSRFTTGFFTNNTWNKKSLTAAAYYQFGKNGDLQKTSAFLASIAGAYAFGKKHTAGAGVDYTSGGSKGGINKSFDPLYGTPHKFWGLMDYFYVASPFGKGGLVDYYLKWKYKATEKWGLAADLHQFSSATAVVVDGKNSKERSLGQELDLVANYALTKKIGIEAGYAHYFSTALLASSNVKNVINASSNAAWAYVMVNIKPEFLFK